MQTRGLSTVEVTQETLDAYNDQVQRTLKGSVWTTGRCAGRYRDAYETTPAPVGSLTR
jgi:hypothetical protein